MVSVLIKAMIKNETNIKIMMTLQYFFPTNYSKKNEKKKAF